jgi:hypothetical protein
MRCIKFCLIWLFKQNKRVKIKAFDLIRGSVLYIFYLTNIKLNLCCIFLWRTETLPTIIIKNLLIFIIHIYAVNIQFCIFTHCLLEWKQTFIIKEIHNIGIIIITLNFFSLTSIIKKIILLNVHRIKVKGNTM